MNSARSLVPAQKMQEKPHRNKSNRKLSKATPKVFTASVSSRSSEGVAATRRAARPRQSKVLQPNPLRSRLAAASVSSRSTYHYQTLFRSARSLNKGKLGPRVMEAPT